MASALYRANAKEGTFGLPDACDAQVRALVEADAERWLLREELTGERNPSL
jgi:hypothetical protein